MAVRKKKTKKASARKKVARKKTTKKTTARKKVARKKAAKKAAKKATKKSTRKRVSRKKTPRKVARRSSRGFNELLGRALTDPEFRDLLFKDRSRAIRGFRLSAQDRETLDRLSRRQLEDQARKLGGRAAITIKVVISKSF